MLTHFVRHYFIQITNKSYFYIYIYACTVKQLFYPNCRICASNYLRCRVGNCDRKIMRETVAKTS